MTRDGAFVALLDSMDDMTRRSRRIDERTGARRLYGRLSAKLSYAGQFRALMRTRGAEL